jgi:hypothetical protein
VSSDLKPLVRCATCRYFRDDPAFLEQALPGLNALSSARGSVRADDGICQHHNRYVSARGACSAHAEC